MMNPKSVVARVVQTVVPLAWLAISHSAQATVATSAPSSGGAAVLQGVWCGQDANSGETIVDYSAAGLEVTAFTVLSEVDPRRIGSRASMQLTMEAPNVFLSRDDAGADQVLRIYGDGLTIDSFRVEHRGTRHETRQALATQSYSRCDMRTALQRAQAFLSSPKAEEATRKALQREQLEREDAEITERRNASQEAYFGNVIEQLSQVRGILRSGG